MSETVAARIQSALDIADLRVRELERLAGLKRGVVQKILDGESLDPRSSTLTGVAPVLGTTSDYLGAGIGDPPSERRVRAAVRAARERRAGGRHVATVTTSTGPRKAARPRSVRA